METHWRPIGDRSETDRQLIRDLSETLTCYIKDLSKTDSYILDQQETNVLIAWYETDLSNQRPTYMPYLNIYAFKF